MMATMRVVFAAISFLLSGAAFSLPAYWMLGNHITPAALPQVVAMEGWRGYVVGYALAAAGLLFLILGFCVMWCRVPHRADPPPRRLP